MISLIVTLLNESGSIDRLLDDILDQSRRPDEVVIVDGGSTDGTIEAIRSRQNEFDGKGVLLKLIIEVGANISQGRNIAVESASSEIICGTDAGCRLDGDWVRAVTQPIVAGEADFVGGFYRPVHHTDFQRVLANLTVADAPPAGFMPSSRSIAFTRTAWAAAGRYPEWLMWGEDTLFNERCIAGGARYVVAPDAIVHWEVRRDLGAAVQQYYHYALGDGERRRVSASHVINAGVVFGSIILAVLKTPLWLLLFPAYSALLVFNAQGRLAVSDMPMAFVIAMCLRAGRALGWLRGLCAPPRTQDETEGGA